MIYSSSHVYIMAANQKQVSTWYSTLYNSYIRESLYLQKKSI